MSEYAEGIINPITKTGTIKVYLLQHPNGATKLFADYSRHNMSFAEHWKVLAETEFTVTLTGDAGYEPDRAYPKGK